MTLYGQNLDTLIAHLRGLSPDQFTIAKTFCGSAACISGWHQLLFGIPLADTLRGLNSRAFERLITPPHFATKPELYPLPRAIDVLCHLRDTGEVRWDLFPAENYRGEPWAAPKAIELKPLALPDEITRLLGVDTVEA